MNALFSAVLALLSPVTSVISKIPLYYYGFAACLLFGFHEGCSCERHHLGGKSALKGEVEPNGFVVTETGPPPTASKDYDTAATEAENAGKPVVVFLGVRHRPVANLITAGVQKLGDVWNSRPGVIVGYPGTSYRVDLNPDATDSDIQLAVTQLATVKTSTVTTTYIENPGCPNGKCGLQQSLPPSSGRRFRLFGP